MIESQTLEQSDLDDSKLINFAPAELKIFKEELEEGHYFEVIVMGGYKIQFFGDNESKVWTATSEDIPGLILEDESATKLIQRVMLAAPEIIELNGVQRAELA